MQFLSCPINDTTSGLTLLTVHRDIPVDIAAAIDEFAKQHQCRMEMLDIINE